MESAGLCAGLEELPERPVPSQPSLSSAYTEEASQGTVHRGEWGRLKSSAFTFAIFS